MRRNIIGFQKPVQSNTVGTNGTGLVVPCQTQFPMMTIYHCKHCFCLVLLLNENQFLYLRGRNWYHENYKANL